MLVELLNFVFKRVKCAQPSTQIAIKVPRRGSKG